MPMSRQLAAHLLRRAGFGGSGMDVAAFAVLDWDAAVDRLLNYQAVDNKAMTQQLITLGKAKPADPAYIRAAWLVRMTYTARPLEEKMTLFWHNHFATGSSKVDDTVAMWRQNELFRAHALDRFDVLLKLVARDPAMLIWLDGNSNRKAAANENWGRELLELFTLGIGNYSEHDVKQAARAFTGWFERQGAFYFNPTEHDYADKTFLGQRGSFNGDDIIDILVQQPATATLLATKLIKWFVTDTPSAAMVQRIAAVYFSSGYRVQAMVEAILKSAEMKAAARNQIKSPLDFVVGLLRGLAVRRVDSNFAYAPALLGMDIFDPPSVKGWDWGTAWISSDTYFARANLANLLTQQADPRQPYYIDALGLLRQAKAKDAPAAVAFYLDLLCDNAVSDQTRRTLVIYLSDYYPGSGPLSEARLRGLLHLILALPEYQIN